MRSTCRAAILAIAVLTLATGARAAAKPMDPSWDLHKNYPPVPSGKSQIVSIFGKPCNSAVNDNTLQWRAADNGVVYTVRYHKKLGGTTSSNVYPDIRKHHHYGGYDDNTKHGIWGYACRYIAGTTKYSTHAWGIAIDINSAYEPVGDWTCNTISSGHGGIWTNHRWTWGKSWADCMHFQYATNY